MKGNGLWYFQEKIVSFTSNLFNWYPRSKYIHSCGLIEQWKDAYKSRKIYKFCQVLVKRKKTTTQNTVNLAVDSYWYVLMKHRLFKFKGNGNVYNVPTNQNIFLPRWTQRFGLNFVIIEATRIYMKTVRQKIISKK